MCPEAYLYLHPLESVFIKSTMAGHVRLNIMFLISFISDILYIDIIDGHMCNHKIPKKHEVIHGVFLEEDHILKKRSIDQKLRIHQVYDISFNKLPPVHNQIIRSRVLPSAVEYWEKTLSVRYTSGPIRLRRQCKSNKLRYSNNGTHPYCVDGCVEITKCGDVEVPAKHLEACREGGRPDQPVSITGVPGEGVSGADFILYISALNTSRCSLGSTIAYAAYCQLEASFDRPVAGYVNICPGAISSKEHEVQQMVSIIKHEILHALGFSAGLFAYYRDSTGKPLTDRYRLGNKPEYNEEYELYQWSDKVVKVIEYDDWETRTGTVKKQVHVVVTPKVKLEVQNHFNCSSLEGAELEDQGIAGTALTHWEKRMFENEVMTGTYTQHPMVSRITLALLEDTGWYEADYRYAEPLLWGKGLGCEFVQKSCLGWMKLRKQMGHTIHPYCDRVKGRSLETECLESRDAVAVCNLVKYQNPLPSKYQYFNKLENIAVKDVGYFGGSVPLADFCPYLQEFNWKDGDTVERGSRCSIEENNPGEEDNFALESYGNTSMCFKHPFPFKLHQCSKSHSVRHWGSGCYKYSCVPQVGLVVHIGEKTFPCYKEGLVIPIRVSTSKMLHDGAVVCPSCTDVCGDLIECPVDKNPPSTLPQVRPVTPCPANQSLKLLNSYINSFIVISSTVVLLISR